MMKLIVAFFSFASAPEKIMLLFLFILCNLWFILIDIVENGFLEVCA